MNVWCTICIPSPVRDKLLIDLSFLGGGVKTFLIKYFLIKKVFTLPPKSGLTFEETSRSKEQLFMEEEVVNKSADDFWLGEIPEISFSKMATL